MTPQELKFIFITSNAILKNINELNKQLKILNVKNLIITHQESFELFKKKIEIKKLKFLIIIKY